MNTNCFCKCLPSQRCNFPQSNSGRWQNRTSTHRTDIGLFQSLHFPSNANLVLLCAGVAWAWKTSRPNSISCSCIASISIHSQRNLAGIWTDEKKMFIEMRPEENGRWEAAGTTHLTVCASSTWPVSTTTTGNATKKPFNHSQQLYAHTKNNQRSFSQLS